MVLLVLQGLLDLKVIKDLLEPLELLGRKVQRG